jgi:trehalose-phosphatase
MEDPAPGNLENFWRKLQNVSQRVLLLDYDGTLAPFQTERDKAFPYPGVREILEKIQSSGQTRLVIVSGRAVADLLPLLGLKNIPEIWGSHGFERRLPDGSMIAQDLDQKSRQYLERAYSWMKAQGFDKDCEIKPASLAFHWRRREKNERLNLDEKVRSAWAPFTKDGDFSIHPFDGGLELRYDSFNKGKAVQQILHEYDKETVFAYLGDDLTDEDAFRALKGKGLSVLIRDTYRDTRADCWLKPPKELLDFLHNWNRFAT